MRHTNWTKVYLFDDCLDVGQRLPIIESWTSDRAYHVIELPLGAFLHIRKSNHKRDERLQDYCCCIRAGFNKCASQISEKNMTHETQNEKEASTHAVFSLSNEYCSCLSHTSSMKHPCLFPSPTRFSIISTRSCHRARCSLRIFLAVVFQFAHRSGTYFRIGNMSNGGAPPGPAMRSWSR